MKNKIKSIVELEEIIRKLKLEKKIVVTTNGSFDILHSAHVNLLEKAKEQGDALIVLLNSDSSIKRNKGEKRPIILENQRARLLAGLQCVDYVCIFDEDTPLKYLGMLKPNVHVKGGSGDIERMSEERKFVESWGGVCRYFELESGFSTSEIIDKILERYR